MSRLWLLVAVMVGAGVARAQESLAGETEGREWRILDGKEFGSLSEIQKKEYLAWAEGHAAAMQACVAEAQAQLEVEKAWLERTRAAVQSARQALREAQAAQAGPGDDPDEAAATAPKEN